jgi:hypothetical protein
MIQTTPRAVAISTPGGLDKYFYLFMSLLIVAVIVYGFSFTIGNNLIHPALPQWHRRLGWFGVSLGTLIPIVGVSTAIAMGRFNTVSLHATHAESDLIIPFFDMVCFTSTFPLAVYWRRKPEMHRRMMLVATCALTAAGFARFPERILPAYWFYAGVDASHLSWPCP